MVQRKIYILTGVIQSGKTTKLLNWIKNKKNKYGILTPVFDGKRYFLNVSTGEKFSTEASAEEKNIIEVGKYRFSKTAFDRATEILQEVEKKTEGLLIIDEIGPLELRKEGFYQTVKSITENNTSLNILLVVRDGLADNVIDLFNLRDEIIEIVNIENKLFDN